MHDADVSHLSFPCSAPFSRLRILLTSFDSPCVQQSEKSVYWYRNAGDSDGLTWEMRFIAVESDVFFTAVGGADFEGDG